MSALTQYTDLARGHMDLIDKGSAAVMNALRPRALEVLTGRELPKAGSENYETTDLEAILAPDYGLNLARVPIDANPAASFRCGVPTLTTSLFFNVNDIFTSTANAAEGLPEGVWAGSLRNFCTEYPDLAAKYYGNAADMDNPLVALDTLFAQDGFAVYVPDGVKVDKPLQLVSILQNGAPLMAVRRVLVIAGAGAEVRILGCDHTQNPDVDFVALQTVEIFAGENSRVDWYEMEESGERTARLSALYLRQERDSRVAVDGITLYNGITRNEYHTLFAGTGADLRLYGMGIEDRRRRLDTYSHIDHAVPGCHTDELFRYVVDDEATGAFTGKVLVRHGADKTEAYQSNRNLVGSDSARMYSKPQLEIYADDVKCSHGAATGQLDAGQVFYMRTRGIPEKEAKLLLKQAFMADVIDAVTMPGLKDRLHILVEKRFAGNRASCASCSGCADRE